MKKCKPIGLVLISILILTMAFSSVNGREWSRDVKVPQQFDQAPMLDDLAKEGELPPLQERLPQEPYVVKPIEKIGTYGGVIHSAALRSDFFGEDSTIMDATCSFALPNPTASGFRINLAKSISASTDKTTWTLRLREGVKWSDGHPFTAEDIMFWYNDILLNEQLTPVVGPAWKAGGDIVEVKKVNDYEINFKFSKPKPFFINRLGHFSAASMLKPKHYLKNFHPNYVSQEELQEALEKEGFDNWWQLFGNKDNVWGAITFSVDRPTLGPYKLVKKTSSRRIYERNPYYWKVDTEGNQLPYVNRIETDIVSNKEVLNGMIISGELDFAGFNTDIRNFPMFKRYEKQGGYKVFLWQLGYGTAVNYMLNLTHQDPVLRKIFQDVRFRRALSLAIDRQEINDSIYFGKAKSRQYTVLETSKYYEPEFANSYIEYDPEKAKKLLIEMGLRDENGDGWLERPDGETLTFTIEYKTAETAKTPNIELVTQHWREIGIKVDSRQVSGELQAQRAPANLMDATIWHDGFATDILFPMRPRYFVPTTPGWGGSIWPAWARWFNTDGKEGEEPPNNELGDKVRKLRNWWEQILTESDQVKAMELSKKILQSQAENLWSIGTVGKTPYAVIADNDLRNVPKTGIWSWSTFWSCSRNPSQLFFEEGVNDE